MQLCAISISKYCDLSQFTEIYRKILRFGNAYKIGATGENAYEIGHKKMMQEMGFEPTEDTPYVAYIYAKNGKVRVQSCAIMTLFKEVFKFCGLFSPVFFRDLNVYFPHGRYI